MDNNNQDKIIFEIQRLIRLVKLLIFFVILCFTGILENMTGMGPNLYVLIFLVMGFGTIFIVSYSDKIAKEEQKKKKTNNSEQDA